MAVGLYGGVTLGTGFDAEVVTNWTGGAAEDTELNFQGATALGAKVGNGTTRFLFTNPSTLNFAAGQAQEDRHVYIWFNFLNAGTLGTTGIRGFVGNDSTPTNYREFTFPGSSDGSYTGGWQNIAIPGTGAGFDFQGGSYNNTAGDVFGITWVGTTNIMGNYNNALIDQITIALGLECTGTSQTFADFTSAESTNVWGILREQQGILFSQGKLRFGDGSTTTGFTSTTDTLIFASQPVDTGFYELLFETASTSTFGTISGGAVSQGSTIRGALTTDTYIITCNGTATVNFYACNISEASAVNLNSNTTVNGTTFNNCGLIDHAGSSFINNNVLGATGTAGLSITTANIGATTGNTFTQNSTEYGIDLGTVDISGGTINITIDNVFNGYSTTNQTTGTAIVANITGGNGGGRLLSITNNTGGTLAINNTGGGGATDYEIINPAKSIDITVEDEDGSPINGAFVWINDSVGDLTNTTTNASGVISTVNYSGTNDSTLRVRLFGYEPFEATLGTAAGSVDQLITLRTDPIQVAVPTLVSSWNINTGTSRIGNNSGDPLPHPDYSTVDEAQDFYEFVQNTFAAASFMQFPIPLEARTVRDYDWVNSWTFDDKDTDYKYLSGGSFFDSANNLQWSNVRSVGSLVSGTEVYFMQGLENADTKFGGTTRWYPLGAIDILVKVRDGVSFTQSTDDSQTAVDGGIWFFAREYGDEGTSFFVDLSPGGQSVIPLSTGDDINNNTAIGTVSAYALTILSGAGPYSRSLDGTNFFNYDVVVQCGSRPLSEVYEYLKYATYKDTPVQINGDDGFEYRNADEGTYSNIDNPEAPFGDYLGGRFFGERGVFLESVSAVDSANYELVDSSGTTRIPPINYAFELTGMRDGTEVRIYRVDNQNEVASVEEITNGTGSSPTTGVTTGGTTDDNTFTYTYEYSVDIDIYVVILNLQWNTPTLRGLTLSNSNQSFPIQQSIDRNYNDPP